MTIECTIFSNKLFFSKDGSIRQQKFKKSSFDAYSIERERNPVRFSCAICQKKFIRKELFMYVILNSKINDTCQFPEMKSKET